MTLQTAVAKLVKEFGKPHHDPEQIANILRRFGASNSVSPANLGKLMKAGRALKALGVN